MAGAILTTSAVGGVCIGQGVAKAGVGLLACSV
jgi:hypothetical protein